MAPLTSSYWNSCGNGGKETSFAGLREPRPRRRRLLLDRCARSRKALVNPSLWFTKGSSSIALRLASILLEITVFQAIFSNSKNV